MSPALQAKLLRVLQEREFEPLGAERTQRVDVRVIAATNRDLRRMVAEGKFQEDLFYRLNVIPIAMPPLRERREDIPAAGRALPAQARAAHGQAHGPVWTDGAGARCQAYDWPGNVRELENTIERAVVLAPRAGHRPGEISDAGRGGASASPGLPSLKLRSNVDWVERETIRRPWSAAAASRRTPPSCSASASARSATTSRSTGSNKDCNGMRPAAT